MSCGFTDPVGCVTDLAGGAASSIAGDAFGSIAKDFGRAADSATAWLWGQLSSSSAVFLITGPGKSTFWGLIDVVAGIALLISMALFIVQIITSVLRQDGRGLRQALTGMATSFIGAALAIGATVGLLRAVDAISAGLLQATLGMTVQQLGTKILGVGVEGAVVNPAGLFLLSIVVLVSVVIVWCALMIRKLLIVVAAVFAPLAFAGASAQITRSWVRRWIEGMVALIMSKLILIIMFLIGYAIIFAGLGEPAHPSGTAKVTNLVAGVLVLAAAGFAPWIAIRLVHFAGDHFATVHGTAQAATAGVHTVATAPQKLQSYSPRGGGDGPGGPPATATSGSPGKQAGGAAQSPGGGAGTAGPGGAGAPGAAGAGGAGAGGSGAGGAAGGAGVAGVAGAVGAVTVSAAKNAGQAAAVKVGAGVPSGHGSAPPGDDAGSPPAPTKRS